MQLRTLSPDRDELERLLSDLRAVPKRSSGRPVLFADPPKPFGQAFADSWNDIKALADTATPAPKRRQLYAMTPWFDRWVEAAYRHELKAAQSKVDRTSPHREPSDLAYEAVAEAAVISESKVHSICQRERTRTDAAQDPEMSAAELKRHLETGPGLA